MEKKQPENKENKHQKNIRESYQKIKKGKSFKWEVNSVLVLLDIAIKGQLLI